MNFYFETILPIKFFAPAPAKEISRCPAHDQFYGLVHLLDIALANYKKDEVLFYVYWTGFLYALSRSDIVWLFFETLRNSNNTSTNNLERLVTAFIWAYFFLYFLKPKFLRNSRYSHNVLLDKIIDLLESRGYFSPRSPKKQILESVLSEILKHENDEMLRLVLELIKHSTSLDIVFMSSIQHKF